MRLSWGHPDYEQAVADWCLAHFPGLARHGSLRVHKAVGLVDDFDQLRGGIVMTDAKPFDAQLSIVLDRKGLLATLTKPMLRELFAWCFEKQGLARLTCKVSADNTVSQRFIERLGWIYEGKQRKGFDGEKDALLYGMTRDDCRWLKE